MRFRNVLVATDFSEGSKEAVGEALRWIDPSAAIEVVHVVDPGAIEDDMLRPKEREALQRQNAQQIHDAGRHMERFLREVDLKDVSNRTLVGRVDDEILARMKDTGADLLVIGPCRHPPNEHLYLGSRARTLLRRAHKSVFVGRKPQWSNGAVIVPTDFGEHARKAADAAAGQRVPVGPTWLIHVIDMNAAPRPAGTLGVPDWVDLQRTIRERLRAENERAFGGLCSEYVSIGEPVSTILGFAKSQLAITIVMGSRGERREGPIVLGSVAAEVADRAPCSVLLVRADP